MSTNSSAGETRLLETTGTRNLLKEIRASLAGARRDYTKGNMGKAILLLAIPMVLEMSMQAVFAVVDVFFVGKLGSDAVAAVGLTGSLLTLIFAVAMGLSMGTTATVARRIGERKPLAAANSAFQAILLGIAISLGLGLVGVFAAPSLLALMGASRNVVATGSGFAAWMLGGNVTVMLLFLINAIFRGAGDAAIAMRALWLANLINIVLDPLLIFGWGSIPALGIDGAAIATNLGRAVGTVYQLYMLQKGRGGIRVSRENLRIQPAIMRRLFRISSLGMLQFLIGTSSWVGVIRILATFGGTPVAAYTIAVRMIIFALLPSWGMGNAAATLVGQNLGARQPDRAERSVWVTAFSNMVFLGCVGVIFALFARPLVGIFTTDSEVIRLGSSCLRTVSYSYVFLAFGMVLVQAFNGAGDTTTPTWINLMAYWLIQIPLAWTFSSFLEMGPQGVFWAIACAQSCLACLAIILFRRGTWKQRVI